MRYWDVQMDVSFTEVVRVTADSELEAYEKAAATLPKVVWERWPDTQIDYAEHEVSRTSPKPTRTGNCRCSFCTARRARKRSRRSSGIGPA